jgi:hypothetical protein
MGARVRSAGEHDLEVVNGGRIAYVGASLGDPVEYFLLGTVEGVGAASLASFRQALIRWRGKQQGVEERPDAQVWVGLTRHQEQELHRELSDQGEVWLLEDYANPPPTNPALYLDGERLRIQIQVWSGENPDPTDTTQLLAPFLERHGASSEVSASPVPEHEGGGFRLTVDIDRPLSRGATVANAWRLGDEAFALLRAAKDGELPRSAAFDLFCAGRWDLFKGQPESDWLDAKGEPYDHLIPELGKNWKYELAKDVAAFANSPDGGIVVLGMTTNDVGDGEEINGHKEFNLSRVRAATYRTHIAQCVYPAVVGFEVRKVEGRKAGHGLVALVIPPQPESSRPFLVTGVISRGTALGNHILLPVRRGDRNESMDASAFHARLRLGEQVIRDE